MDHGEKDLITNIAPFFELGNIEEDTLKINARWKVKDVPLYINHLVHQDISTFDDFIRILDNLDFIVEYSNDTRVVEDFKLKDLLEITTINANKVQKNNSLSHAFGKIIEFRYKALENKQNKLESLDQEEKEENEETRFYNQIKNTIKELNNNLSDNFQTVFSNKINSSLTDVLRSEECQILLKSDLDFQKILKNLLRYEYKEKDFGIPENQFGLGYTNLIMIIAELVHYISKYPESSFTSHLNFIIIEEPEVHMHPQMQENLIFHIEKMIESLLENFDKKIKTQIIITTHSSHIVNSKIHSGNTFNNMNYISEKDGHSYSVALKDEILLEQYKGSVQQETSVVSESSNDLEKQSEERLTFLKKHIKFNISDIFFADAVIFVEGATEYTLLNHYLSNNPLLNNFYITLALVNGTHAHVYFPLIELLGIPTLIITDLDIEREEDEKKCFKQITKEEIDDKETTNTFLAKVCKTEKLSLLVDSEEILIDEKYKIPNLRIVTQNKLIADYYATSFEEALILSNLNNPLLISSLKKTRIELSKDWIIGNKIQAEKSFEIQMKLSDYKMVFASNVLYELLVKEVEDNIKLPTYIEDGFKWLEEKLNSKAEVRE